MKDRTANGLAFARYGKRGGRAVVLITGVTESHPFWDPVVAKLDTERLDVIAVDVRGHGNSPMPTFATPESVSAEGFRLPDHVADLKNLFVSLELERPVLVGHSFGGMIALEAARVHANDVSALMLVASSVTGVGNATIEAIKQTVFDDMIRRAAYAKGIRYPQDVRTLTLVDLEPHFEEWLRDVWCHDTRVEARWCAECVERMKRLKIGTWLGVLTALSEVNLGGTLAGLTLPVLCMQAEFDEMFDSAEHTGLLEAALPRAKLRFDLVPNSGHNIPWHATSHLAETICAFTDGT